MTGPSATADIEGVLIHGAQGIRTLTVIPVARAMSGCSECASRNAIGFRNQIGIFATSDRMSQQQIIDSATDY